MTTKEEAPQPRRRIVTRGAPPKLVTKFELVTPALAEEWLGKVHPLQRAISRSSVDALKRDLLSDNFKPTHQGIAFDEEGLLVDGQHRLKAIAESGRGTWLMVTHGVVDIANIDTALNVRSMAHARKIRGNNSDEYNKKYIATIRSLGLFLIRGANRKITISEADAIERENQEALEWVKPFCGKFPGYELAALVTAYPCNRPIVNKFTEQIVSLVEIKRGSPAQLWVSWRAAKPRVMGGAAAYKMSYMRLLAAVRATIEGRTISYLRDSAETMNWFLDARNRLGIADDLSEM